MLYITMSGFFGRSDVEALRTDLVDKIKCLGAARNQHLTLCDVAGMAIQTQDIVAEFAVLVATPELQAKKLAFVDGSTPCSFADAQIDESTERAIF